MLVNTSPNRPDDHNVNTSVPQMKHARKLFSRYQHPGGAAETAVKPDHEPFCTFHPSLFLELRFTPYLVL